MTRGGLAPGSQDTDGEVCTRGSGEGAMQEKGGGGNGGAGAPHPRWGLRWGEEGIFLPRLSHRLKGQERPCP